MVWGCGRRRQRKNRRASRPITVVVALVAGSALVSLAGCGSAAPLVPHASAPTTTTSPAPTGPTTDALAAYRGMWADMVSASQTADYQSPLLPDHASGNALALLVHGLYLNGLHGIVTKGTPILHPQVTSLSPAGTPTKATIADCFDDTHWLEYKTSGGLVNNIPGGRRATEAIVQESAGVWKVSALVVHVAGTC
jgi:hypothetical protein